VPHPRIRGAGSEVRGRPNDAELGVFRQAQQETGKRVTGIYDPGQAGKSGAETERACGILRIVSVDLARVVIGRNLKVMPPLSGGKVFRPVVAVPRRA
jgi:hypothetical protein